MKRSPSYTLCGVNTQLKSIAQLSVLSLFLGIMSESFEPILRAVLLEEETFYCTTAALVEIRRSILGYPGTCSHPNFHREQYLPMKEGK